MRHAKLLADQSGPLERAPIRTAPHHNSDLRAFAAFWAIFFYCSHSTFPAIVLVFEKPILLSIGWRCNLL
jgi:hypothetical protein